MLLVKHLCKSFTNVQAVQDISFHITKGSTFALLGTNGAGKSTVIHMITGLLKSDQGDIQFLEKEAQDAVGVVFQSHRLDNELTIEENLMLRAKLHQIKRKKAQKQIAQLLELTDLADKRKRLYGKCSGGEKRKTDLIRALLHEPKFLILDEPTTGLDAESREEIWLFLNKLQKEKGLTILLTTHYIEEAEEVDYVLIMHEGKIEVEGTPRELKERYAQTSLHLEPLEVNRVIEKLVAGGYPFQIEDKLLVLPLEKTTDAIPILKEVEASIQNFTIERSSLEQVFLSVTKQIKRR